MVIFELASIFGHVEITVDNLVKSRLVVFEAVRGEESKVARTEVPSGRFLLAPPR